MKILVETAITTNTEIMIKTKVKPQKLLFTTDSEFDQIYPENIRKLSDIHWTPIDIARMAVDWLQLDENSRLLDIGSGVGKFCCIAGEMSSAQITGVEKRKNLVAISEKVISKKELNNVRIINSNITQVDFKDFNTFYYYNPFCEQISTKDSIDNTILYSQNKYRFYEDYVIDQLDKLPIGVKIVTYYSQAFTLSESYALKNLYFNSNLALWTKIK